ncbi:hypothetical protein LP415_01060 [Polaromonas sp. P1(28)-8]|nr:hypothetical protein LP415_01060 [Polaromonas sp. P1(28)-8]
MPEGGKNHCGPGGHAGRTSYPCSRGGAVPPCTQGRSLNLARRARPGLRAQRQQTTGRVAPGRHSPVPGPAASAEAAGA